MYTYMWPVTWKGYYTVLKCKFCIVWTKLTSRSATSKGCPPSKHWTLTRLRLGQFRQLFVFWLPPFHEHLSIATSALQDSGVRGGGNGRTLLQCSHLYGFSDTEWAEPEPIGQLFTGVGRPEECCVHLWLCLFVVYSVLEYDAYFRVAIPCVASWRQSNCMPINFTLGKLCSKGPSS